MSARGALDWVAALVLAGSLARLGVVVAAQLAWPLDLRYETPNLCTVQVFRYGENPYSPAVYDDADFDDVVGLVTSAEALATAASTADLPLVTPRTSPQDPLRESAILRFPTATLHARAPPAR